MVDTISGIVNSISRLSEEVGFEGRLGAQSKVEYAQGSWKTLQDNVNTMANTLTTEVRSVAEVAKAVTNGNLERKIEFNARGEVLEMKETVNGMVHCLSYATDELIKVTKGVGCEGKLGVFAEDAGMQGTWQELTLYTNTMAGNLTTQLRGFAQITAAATDGDFTRFIAVEASHEMDLLKPQIKQMVFTLRDSVEKNVNALEAAELAGKSKSEFLTNLSHESRTPLNSIIDMTQLTLDSDLNQSQRESLLSIQNHARSLLRIIDTIPDFSKVEALG
ncbi:hypothetical protein DXG01_002181 [Tephrocybe rancida]|nr:hypothetical protein DXG01_002181 [Tephrocybe rancida]